jgi:hypothetical protein
MSKSIKGTVTYQDLGTGCWGIVDDAGNEWRVVNMPEQLKENGKKVTVKVKPAKEEFSTFMWGKPVEVVSFST